MGLVKSMANEMMKEIGNKSREFYEFVLPPVDMHLDDEKLTVLIDLPGFEKKDIRLSLDENILSIQACKEEVEESHHMICNQRPNVIDKKIRLPVDVNDEEDAVSSAKYSQGVLTIIIPVHKHGKEIKVE
ncbi:MAG: archaeal heat shock protein Hsp14 [Candidatus Nitrosomaritimum aestuariumsis]|jgi:HSP20 family molecular chaperone IbpA|uniref:Hsp20/alpha crystallin family protein n=1 Tax=Candidatus Nitrosomaritimum aestuariumsis TaxID=3342354 RepID=A0AC60W7Q9_9ARCH|nr:Hsp20/alpha crystallin family protein [Nitrosopumilaceae archaeon]NCF21435.1 Hsp20 family protein [Nitrosopumilaceae archaeon]